MLWRWWICVVHTTFGRKPNRNQTLLRIALELSGRGVHWLCLGEAGFKYSSLSFRYWHCLSRCSDCQQDMSRPQSIITTRDVRALLGFWRISAVFPEHLTCMGELSNDCIHANYGLALVCFLINYIKPFKANNHVWTTFLSPNNSFAHFFKFRLVRYITIMVWNGILAKC